MKLVSLIIPVYNAGPYFAPMLESVLAQTYPSIELVVVNDGSTDDSHAVFSHYESRLKARFPSVTYLIHNHNKSASEAMNTALPYCTGEFLMWADADDQLLPENVEKKVSYLESHPEYVLVRCNGTQIDLITGDTSELAKPADKQPQSVFEALLSSKTYCHCGCYMVRSAAFFSCYPDKRIPVSRQGQNMQMLLPPASLSNCGYIDDSLYVYQIHTSNHSRSFVTFPHRLERMNGFECMQLEVLPHCQCDQAQWAEKVRNIWNTARNNLRTEYFLRIRRKMNGGSQT